MLEIFRKMNIEDRIISFLVGNMKQDTTRKLFYGKPQKAGAVLKPLRETLYPEKAFASNKQCRTAILFYAQVWIRSHGGLSSEFRKKAYICAAVKEKFGQFPSDTIDEAIDVCLGYIYENEPALKKTTVSSPWDSEPQEGGKNGLGDLAKLMEMIQAREAVNKQAAETAEGNKEVENKYLDDPEYGLVQEKPVFVKGFGAHRDYLNRLRTESGANLEYSRLGSLSVEGIAGRVDEYSITPKDGTKGMAIYLCLYGSSNSTTAPKGLKLVSSEDGDSSPNTEVQASFTFF